MSQGSKQIQLLMLQLLLDAEQIPLILLLLLMLLLLLLFQLVNHLQTNSVAFNDRKKHLHDNLKVIVDYFKQLKHIYATVKDSCDKMNMKPVTVSVQLIHTNELQILQEHRNYSFNIVPKTPVVEDTSNTYSYSILSRGKQVFKRFCYQALKT